MSIEELFFTEYKPWKSSDCLAAWIPCLTQDSERWKSFSKDYDHEEAVQNREIEWLQGRHERCLPLLKEVNNVIAEIEKPKPIYGPSLGRTSRPLELGGQRVNVSSTLYSQYHAAIALAQLVKNLISTPSNLRTLADQIECLNKDGYQESALMRTLLAFLNFCQRTRSLPTPLELQKEYSRAKNAKLVSISKIDAKNLEIGSIVTYEGVKHDVIETYHHLHLEASEFLGPLAIKGSVRICPSAIGPSDASTMRKYRKELGLKAL